MDESWFIDVHYIRLSRFMFQLNSMIYLVETGRVSTSEVSTRKSRTPLGK